MGNASSIFLSILTLIWFLTYFYTSLSSKKLKHLQTKHAVDQGFNPIKSTMLKIS